MREDVEKIRVQLQALRPILLNPQGQAFLNVFDEFVQEEEFELALHAVCDFIVDTDAFRVSKPIIDKLEQLHTMMGINDHCVKVLNKKLQ